VADRRADQPTGAPAASGASFATAKGGPAVGVYIRRGGRTFLWNGTEPVEPGDALRLKIVPDGMTRVHVFGRATEEAELTLLHRAAIAPDRDALLDTAWRVDGEGEREVLVVVLSPRPLSIASARAAARSGATEREQWVVRLILPKRRASGADGPAPVEAGREGESP
jgi:hypothetical protein